MTLSITTHSNGYTFHVNGKDTSVTEIKHALIKPSQLEVLAIETCINCSYGNGKNDILYNASTKALKSIINGNRVSDILVRDQFDNIGSKIVVSGKLASFRAMIKQKDGSLVSTDVRRSIKNNSVIIDNVRYKLNKSLIVKV